MTVLVIGPTGTVGSRLLPLLMEQRTPVRALAHANGGAASRLTGVEVATGDLTDPSTLVQAMTGVQRVYLLTRPAPADLHVQMERNVLDAAVKTGVAHIVKPSVHLAAPDARHARSRHSPRTMPTPSAPSGPDRLGTAATAVPRTL